MKLYDLGTASWADSQLSYHALAAMGREGLILIRPDRPYVCLGFHQDLTQELDLEHCRQAGLPIFRREVGGGAVYLDPDQVFWQVVLRRDHPLVHPDRQVFYRRFLGPVARAYQDLGVAAAYKPVNDLVVGRRKICGTGAGEIGPAVVFVGNIMRAFDCAAMARVLALPSPGFRTRFQASMEANLTSLRRELGPEAEAAISDDQVRRALAARFAEVLEGLLPASPTETAELKAAMTDLGERMLDPEWTWFKRKPRARREVKVRAGLFLHHAIMETPAGRILAEYALDNERITGLRLVGERPAEADLALAALADGLEGVHRGELESTLAALPRLPVAPAAEWLRLFRAGRSL